MYIRNRNTRERQDIHLYEPCDELYERRQHRRITDLLDDEDCERWLVPGQPLRSWVLDGPGKYKVIVKKAGFLHAICSVDIPPIIIT